MSWRNSVEAAAVEDFDEIGYRNRLVAAGLAPDVATATAAKTAAIRNQHTAYTVAALTNPNPDLFGPQGAQTTPSHTVAASGTDETDRPVGIATPRVDQGRQPAPLIFKPVDGKLSMRQRHLIEDALQIEQEDARKANATGYMARTLAQATLPHADPKIPLGQLYYRDTGKLTLTVAPTSKRHGIPYGTIPRVILAWICTEAVRTNDRTLSLGHSQAEFLEKIGLHSNGRDISRFKDQALRLFKSVISVEYADDQDGDESARLLISSQSHVFWHPKRNEQRALWDSTLELSEDFAREILASPVPIDLRVFHSLSKSPLAMDVYTWLTYRMFVLRRSGRPFVMIPWIGLKMQFGAGYPDTQRGLYDFKANFKKRLREVLTFYPEARNCIDDDKKSGSLKLWPAHLHIAYHKKSIQ